MPTIIPKAEAIILLGLPRKVFDNYYQSAFEFAPEPRINGRGFLKFDKEKLLEWKRDYENRTVVLNKDDYDLCLDFALAMHFRSYVLSDFGTGRQREFGQKITNWVKGQLGEVGFKKFLHQKFGYDVELDFNIYDEIVPQDIVAVHEGGAMREPRLGIGIKSSKPKNIALILGSNEIEIPERSSDVYVFCRPDLPDDHLLRLAKNEVVRAVSGKPLYETYKDSMPVFSNINCEIAGFCYKNELQRVTSIPGQPFDGHRYVQLSGKLRRSRAEWERLLSNL